jgi:hypothetical protein
MSTRRAAPLPAFAAPPWASRATAGLLRRHQARIRRELAWIDGAREVRQPVLLRPPARRSACTTAASDQSCKARPASHRRSPGAHALHDAGLPARLFQALALTVDRVDVAAGVLVLESLKKRLRGIYRAVPVPPVLLNALDLVHGIRE